MFIISGFLIVTLKLQRSIYMLQSMQTHKNTAYNPIVISIRRNQNKFGKFRNIRTPQNNLDRQRMQKISFSFFSPPLHPNIVAVFSDEYFPPVTPQEFFWDPYPYVGSNKKKIHCQGGHKFHEVFSAVTMDQLMKNVISSQ